MNRPKISGYSRVETAKKMVDSLAFQDLRVHFFTGKAVLLSGSGKDKKYTYRSQ